MIAKVCFDRSERVGKVKFYPLSRRVGKVTSVTKQNRYYPKSSKKKFQNWKFQIIKVPKSYSWKYYRRKFQSQIFQIIVTKSTVATWKEVTSMYMYICACTVDNIAKWTVA